MEIFLSCIFVIAIIILIFRIIDFSVKMIIHNKQMSTRNYDIESVLDRWENAEKQFQKDDKIEEDNVCDSTVVSSQDQNTSVKESVLDLSLIADKGIIL